MNWKKSLDEMKVDFLLKSSVIPGWGFQPRNNLYKGKIWNLVAGEQ